MSAEQPASAESSTDLPAAAPEANATLPAAVTTASAPAASASEIEAEKRRLKIGSQRDGSTAKVPPRVITEFKTPAGGVTPPKQVFVSLDQAGKFQPLAAPSKPAATAPTSAPPAAREQRPPQPPRQQPTAQQQHSTQQTPPQQARPPRHEEQNQDPSGDEAPAATTNLGYRPKPAPLTANVNAAPKAPVVEKQGPRIAPPNLREKLGDDLEAELAAALGEGSLNELIESTSPKSAGTEIEQDTKQKARVLRTSAEYVFVDRSRDVK